MGAITANPTISLQTNLSSPWIIYFGDGIALFGCVGSPEGVIAANARSIAVTEVGAVYVKTTDTVTTGWSMITGGGGGGTITGSIVNTQVAVGSGVNAIGGSSALVFASGVLGVVGVSNPGITVTGNAATEAGITINQAVTGAAADAFLSFASSSDAMVFRLTSDTFTPTGLVKARQLDLYAATGIVETLFRIQDATSQFAFAINGGYAARLQATSTENLRLGSDSAGLVPLNGQLKFQNATNTNYWQFRATAFAASRIVDLPLGSPTGTQALVGTLSGSTITLAWGSAGSSLTATQVGFGDVSNVLSGSAAFTYDDTNGIVDLTKSTLNASVRYTVTNSNAGNAAQARFGASANVSGAALIAYSSAFVTSGLRVANSVVLDMDGPVGVIVGQAAGQLQFGLGVTEYARLTTARFGVLSFGLGAALGSIDTILERDAANVLALRNGTTAQSVRVYNTYTDASNYERLQIYWTGNVGTITTAFAGTGVKRSLDIVAGDNLRLGAGTATAAWVVSNNSGHLVAGIDNTYDIGASGASRPRTGYFGTSVITSILRVTGINNPGNSRQFWTFNDSNERAIFGDALTNPTIQFGGATTSFPAIGRSGASLVFQLADGTLQTPILPINTNQLQFGGADAASPGAIALRVQNVVGGTSNTSGQNFSIYGSQGTGNAVGGAIILRVAPAGSSGTSQNSTVVGLAIDGTGRLYGSALHNNAAGMSGSVNQYIGSGTYTPTLTNVANVAASTTQTFQYIRVGNVVTVSGWVTVDPTSATTLTRLGITLPIASNFTQAYQCNGTGATPDVQGYSGSVLGDTTNDRAELNFTTATDVADRVWQVFFQYEVL